MKKLILILTLLFIFTGCSKRENNYEEIMKEYATEHFNLHMSGSEFLIDPNISLSDLKNAVALMGDKYDLTKLSNCKNTSYVTLILNKETNQIIDYKFYLECK